MPTERQIAANQKNAQKCCGPKTPETKAISSMNALKTGIDCKSEVMRCESRKEYNELIAGFHARFLPATPEEQSFVDALIRHEWLSRRYMCVETGIWERRFTDWNSRSLGQVFLRDSQEFSRAGQLFNAARRGFAATLKQLREAQNLRAKEPPVEILPIPEPEPSAASVIDVPDAGVAFPDLARVDTADPNTAPVIPVTAPVARTSSPQSRDGEGSVPEIPNPHTATKPLNPKLDSFLTFPDPPPAESPEAPENAPNPAPQAPEKGENDPPIAA
jgi:hypothetical protein